MWGNVERNARCKGFHQQSHWKKDSSQRLWIGWSHFPHCNPRGAPFLLNDLQKLTCLSWKPICHPAHTSSAWCNQLEEAAELWEVNERQRRVWKQGETAVAIHLLWSFKIIRTDSNVSCGFWSRSPEAVGGVGGCLRWDFKWKAWWVERQ